MKKLRYITLLAAAAFVFSGCNIIKVNPDRDGAQIVAVVYGENITKKEVYDAAQITWGQKVEAWNVANVQTQKEQALERLILNKVYLHVAKDKGMYNFTDDENKQIDDFVTSYIKATYDAALAKYQNEAKTDPSIKPEERANADVDAQLASEGTSREKLKQYESDYIAYQKLNKSIIDPITPADSDVKSEYDAELKAEQTAYDADPLQAVTDDNGSSKAVVYYPQDGFFRVKQILIPLPQDIQSQLSSDRSNGNSTDAETLRTSELAKIKATADEALTKAKAANGDLAKLDQLIKDYGDNDPGMDSKPEGYLVYKGTTYYEQSFTDAALALTDIGVPSELVATDYGFHIIWISQKIAKGIVPYDQVKVKLTEIVKAAQQDTAWQNAATGWMSDASSQIQRFTGRLND